MADSELSCLGPFRALDHTFAIELVGDVAVDVAGLFESLRDTAFDDAAIDTPAQTYRFSFEGTTEPTPESTAGPIGELHVDGDLVASGTMRTLLQLLITKLGQALATDLGGAIHGTTVTTEAGTVTLVGPSRRGKSTLAARLLAAGAELVAEDVSAFDADGRVRPYHRPLGLSEKSFELLDLAIPPEAGAPCGCGGKVLVASDQLGFGLAGAARPRVVALVDQRDDTLTPLTPARMLAALLEAGVAPLPDPAVDLDTLIGVLAGARCVELGSADLDVAADWIGQLLERGRGEPEPTLVEQRGDRVDVFCGREAVIVDGDQTHHLNETAAAVWLLHTDGLARDQIATELEADPALVEETFAALAEVVGTGA